MKSALPPHPRCGTRSSSSKPVPTAVLSARDCLQFASPMRNLGPKATRAAGSLPIVKTAVSKVVNTQRCDRRRRVRPRCVEAVLYRLLKRVPPDTRLALISCRFSQQQRLALERWIVTQRASPPHLRAEEPRFVWHAPAGTVVASPRSKASLQVKQVSSSEVSRTALGQPLPVGVHRRSNAGRIYYSVTRAVGPFNLFTRSAQNRTEALQRHALLNFMRRCYSMAASAPTSDQVACSLAWLNGAEQAFRFTLDEVVAHYGVEAVTKIAIRFAGTVPAKLWVGRSLSTPRFAIMNSDELDAGLGAWRRLSACRGLVHCGRINRYTILAQHTPHELKSTWHQLKAVYLDIWASAGRNRSTIEAQLSDLEAQHGEFQKRLAELWVLLRLSRKMPAGEALTTIHCYDTSKAKVNDRKRHLTRAAGLLQTGRCKRRSICSQSSGWCHTIELNTKPPNDHKVSSGVANDVHESIHSPRNFTPRNGGHIGHRALHLAGSATLSKIEHLLVHWSHPRNSHLKK